MPSKSAASSGPGRAQRKGRSEGRATAKESAGRPAKGASSRPGGPKRNARIGRYTPPEQGGRYTPPVPKKVRRSPAWYGVTLLALLILGVLMILLNYLSVLPGGVSGWYLVGGLVMLFGGFLMATRYR